MYHIRTEENKVKLYDNQEHIGAFSSAEDALNFLQTGIDENNHTDTIYVEIDGGLDILTQGTIAYGRQSSKE